MTHDSGSLSKALCGEGQSGGAEAHIIGQPARGPSNLGKTLAGGYRSLHPGPTWYARRLSEYRQQDGLSHPGSPPVDASSLPSGGRRESTGRRTATITTGGVRCMAVLLPMVCSCSERHHCPGRSWTYRGQWLEQRQQPMQPASPSLARLSTTPHPVEEMATPSWREVSEP